MEQGVRKDFSHPSMCSKCVQHQSLECKGTCHSLVAAFSEPKFHRQQSKSHLTNCYIYIQKFASHSFTINGSFKAHCLKGRELARKKSILMQCRCCVLDFVSRTPQIFTGHLLWSVRGSGYSDQNEQGPCLVESPCSSKGKHPLERMSITFCCTNHYPKLRGLR